MTPPPRADWIDSLKGVGIVLVLLGHTNGIGVALDRYIYSFHMALFFFAAGLTVSPGRLAQPLAARAADSARSLLLPYFIFGLLTWLPWVALTRHHGADAALGVPAWKPLLGLLYGVGVDGWLQHNAMLWFFPCLFVVHLLFQMAARGSRRRLLVLLGAAALAGWLAPRLLPVRLPFGADVALTGLAFMGLGHLARGPIEAFRPAPPACAAALVLLAAAQGLCVALNGRVDMNFMAFGNPILFHAGALAGILWWTVLLRALPTPPLLPLIGRQAVVIFPLHRTTYSVFTGVAVFGLGLDTAYKSTLAGSVAYAALAIAVLLPVAALLRRHAPWVLGARGRPA